MDPFIVEIETVLQEIEVTTGTLSDLSVRIPLRVLAIHDSDLLVGIDQANMSLVLLNSAGRELSRVGGSGRGPEEFKGIGRLHIGDDGYLYVMDPVLRRFHVFDIDVKNNELIYETSIVPEPDLNLRLQEIYVTERGYYGVFNQTNDYLTGANSYHLYVIDETFRPVKHLLEMPGNEKLKISEVFFIDDQVGQSTYWDLDGEWFYYITSHSSEIHKYHLENGDRKTVNYFSLKDRLNTTDHVVFLKNRLETLIKENPPVGEAIEESRTLPLFRNFLVQGDRILFDTYYAGGGHGVIILVDNATKEVKYIKSPPYFDRMTLRDQALYGINFTDPDEEYTVMFIMLNDE